MERKPAHLAIIDEIERHCKNLESFEKARQSRRDPPFGFEQTAVLEMAALPALADLLKVVIIPKKDLDQIIIRLKCLIKFHSVIQSAVENLSALQCQCRFEGIP